MDSFLTEMARRLARYDALSDAAGREDYRTRVWGVEEYEVEHWRSEVAAQRHARATVAAQLAHAEEEPAQSPDHGRVVQPYPQRRGTSGTARGKRRPETPVPSGGPGRRDRSGSAVPTPADPPRRFVMTITITVEG
ncbi:hypothetical protein [Kitasatospora sp. CB02891]|uniref:hypothetical protein n=1 Tax=Kitasatospora sp. CB02891 TaxID=2020329 RepID=UPI000C26FA1C|nr:hypothetical protein [Kitasatospora sp. CB02891]PJN25994.1 hypothetical protein CG736_11345 [Kitasatospora sp. CB02891]